MEQRIYFHGMRRGPISLDQLREAARNAVSKGFSPSTDHGDRARLWVSREDRERVSVSVDAAEPGIGQILVGPIRPSTFEAYGTEAIGELCLSLAAGTKMQLARSYFPEPGTGIVQPAEPDGTLEFVDWLQYLSPRIAARWGMEKLKAGPFLRVDELEGGAAGIWLASDPFNDRIGRKAAAEYLGITLATFEVEHADGSGRTAIRWD